ncbi:MAG TPA: M20 family metallopeptidase [Planctomycetota bacterium]|nr:M20 family metallopeptidase [Planctomycetota bacterium]
MAIETAQIKRIIHEVYPKIRTLRRDLHRHPETQFAEVRTARQVVKHLRKLKIACRTKVGRTGVVGLLKGKRPGPCVALRADMDALPVLEKNRVGYRSAVGGKMHACGHDGHTANLVGVAHVLHRCRDHIRGSVKFIFQPAEESGLQGGAELMIADGTLRNPKPDVIFGLHTSHVYPVGTVASIPGPCLASADFFDVRIHGRGAHAAYPHKGIDPVTITGAVIQALQTIASRRIDPLEPVVVTVGRVSGGSARNIIPETVTFGGTTRTYDRAVRRTVRRQVQKIPKDVARAMGGSAEVDYLECYPAVINDGKVFAFLKATATSALGRRGLLEAAPSMGGEDFAFYLETTPGVFFWLGNGSPNRQLHSATFNFNDRALKTGMLVMTELVLRWPDRT